MIIHIIILLFLHYILYQLAVKNNSIYLLMINMGFLFVVTSQAIYIGLNFGDDNSLFILDDYISKSGYYLSLYLYEIVLLFLILLIIIYYINNNIYIKHILYKKNKINHYKYNLNKFHYVLLILIIALAILYYLIVVGDLMKLIVEKRPSKVPGATLPQFIILGSSSIFMFKLYSNLKLNILDYIIIGFAAVYFTMAGSRIFIVYYYLQVFLAYFYGSSRKLNFKYILVFLLGGYIFVIGSQAFKHYLFTQFLPVPLTLQESLFYATETFCAGQTEGFSSWAACISHYLEYGHSHDWGLSALAFIFQFIPGQIRENPIFAGNQEYLFSFYGFNQSIIPSGLTNYFCHFGILSLIIYPLTFYFMFILENKIKEKYVNPLLFNMIVIILVQSIALIRGTTFLFLNFIFVLCIIQVIYYFIFYIKLGVVGTKP